MATFDPYTRKSTADGGKSAADQLAEIVEDLEFEGHEVGEKFSDPESSASRFRRSDPQDFVRLMAKIEAGACDGIAMWESSRGSRDPEIWFPLLGACRRTGTLIRVTSHGRTYDMRNRRDWKTLADDGVASADESELKSERSRRGHRIAAKSGTPSGQLLFGHVRIYDERGKYVETVLHPERSAVVMEIFNRIAVSDEVTAIARDLNERNVARAGRYNDSVWRTCLIRQIVRNPGYAGLRVHKQRIVGKAAWPAVVSEDLWRRANAVLDDPQRRTARSTELKHLLGGAARCGHPSCPGRPAVTAKRGRRAQPARPGRLISRGRDRQCRRRYACEVCEKSSIVAEELDAFIERLVLERLAREDGRSLFQPVVRTADLDAASARVGELEDQLRELAQDLAARKISSHLAGATEAILLPQLEEAKAKKQALEAPAPLAWLGDIDVVSRWESLGIRLQREVVRAVADIVVGPATRLGGNAWNPDRLAASRWIGDTQTWGEIWAERGVTA